MSGTNQNELIKPADISPNSKKKEGAKAKQNHKQAGKAINAHQTEEEEMR